jgi:hypothetical protein
MPIDTRATRIVRFMAEAVRDLSMTIRNRGNGALANKLIVLANTLDDHARAR